jgi:uncharacterized membrane protein YfcA
MPPDLFIFLLALASVAAGFLGALTGLGGGVIIIPLLVLAFGIDIKYAVGTSLVAVIATSSGAAAAYVRDGFTNIRIGIFLEVATVLGALFGAFIAGLISPTAITLIFVAALFWSAYATLKGPPEPLPLPSPSTSPTKPNHKPDPNPDLATRLNLHSSYPTSPTTKNAASTTLTHYTVSHAPAAFIVMLFAGVLSALAGIGSGVVKVIAMDRLMRLPFKVSTTTSNFMIGVTAAASAGIYWHRGQISPALTAPVALGALLGSILGAKALPRVNTTILRRVFAITVIASGLELLRRTLFAGATP